MIIRYSSFLLLTSTFLCLLGTVPCLGDDTPAKQEAPSEAETVPSVKVCVQFVQLAASETAEAATAGEKAAHAGEPIRSDQDSAQETGTGRPSYELTVQESANWLDHGLQVQSAGKNGQLQYGGVRISLKDGVVQTTAEASDETPTEPSVRVLLAPTMVVNPGHPAAINVGERVPYMEKRDDGSLVVKHSESMLEGIEIDVLIDEATPDSVSFQEMSLKISKVVGRQEIPGVPFDVGRPIVRSAAISTALRVGYDHVVAISVPNVAQDQARIVVLIGVERSE